MEEVLIRQYKLSREELRARLLQALEDKDIRVKGETRLIFTDWGVAVEEVLPLADETNGKAQDDGNQ